MARQSFLNLSWVNVVTTANNEIFGAACDPQVAIGVHPPQIPRTQVTFIMIEVFVLGRLRVGVAQKHPRIINADFSNLIDIALLGSRGPVAQNFNGRIWQRKANRPDFF